MGAGRHHRRAGGRPPCAGRRADRDEGRSPQGRREHEAYEAEAFGQGQITELLQTRLDDLLPEPLDDVQEREEEERQLVMDLLNGTG